MRTYTEDMEFIDSHLEMDICKLISNRTESPEQFESACKEFAYKYYIENPEIKPLEFISCLKEHGLTTEAEQATFNMMVINPARLSRYLQ